VILKLWDHCIYLVFVFLLLVPFFPWLSHTTLILHEFEGEKVGIFEKHLSGLAKIQHEVLFFVILLYIGYPQVNIMPKGAQNPWQLSFVWWHQIFMGP
jgi:hypothetical protein